MLIDLLDMEVQEWGGMKDDISFFELFENGIVYLYLWEGRYVWFQIF